MPTRIIEAATAWRPRKDDKFNLRHESFLAVTIEVVRGMLFDFMLHPAPLSARQDRAGAVQGSESAPSGVNSLLLNSAA